MLSDIDQWWVCSLKCKKKLEMFEINNKKVKPDHDEIFLAS